MTPSVRRVLRFNALLLCMFTTWTVVIKFFNPLCLAWASTSSGGGLEAPYIMWDFWWIAHLALAYWFWRQKPFAWEFGISMCVVELTLSGFKLWEFLSDPLKPFTNAPPLIDRFLAAGWLSNRVCLLAFFTYLALQLCSASFRRQMRAGPSVDPALDAE